jgi:hypothetical protein
VTQKILINGQAYDSPDAMPPEVREQYEAALRLAGATGQAQTTIVRQNFIAMVNGKIVSAPSDLPPETRAELEHLRATTGSTGVHTTITVNGTHYSSIDAMPGDVRAQYESALAALAASGPAGKLESAALRQVLRFGSRDDQRSALPWRVIGWLFIGALALFYFLTRSHRS